MIEILQQNNSLSSLDSKGSSVEQHNAMNNEKIYSAEDEWKLFDKIIKKTVMHYQYCPIMMQCDLLFKSSHEQRDF